MSNTKFEIKITKEADGSDVELFNMSVQASKALVQILEAMNSMAEAESDSSDIRVSVREGSAAVELNATPKALAGVSQNVENVLARRSFNDTYITSLQSLQKIFLSNGLTYESDIIIDNKRLDLVGILTSKKRFRAPRRIRPEQSFDIRFIKGRLIENGGVKPNIHVEYLGQKQKVKCSEQQARGVNRFLYSEIFISAWVENGIDMREEFTLCDHYFTESLFVEFREEITEILDGSGTEPLLKIHKKFKELIVSDRKKDARKFVRIFTNKLVNKHMQRTILVAVKAFKEDPDFKDLLEIIVDSLEKKTGRSII